MATLKTRYSLGDTIEFIDPSGKQRKEEVVLIEVQLVPKPFGMYVLYGYGNINLPQSIRKVSERKILEFQRNHT